MTKPNEFDYPTSGDYTRALEAYCDAQAVEIERLHEGWHKANGEVLDTALELTTLRAAAQQALEWFEWFHGDKTQSAATGTDVHEALTNALKGTA